MISGAQLGVGGYYTAVLAEPFSCKVVTLRLEATRRSA